MDIIIYPHRLATKLLSHNMTRKLRVYHDLPLL